MKRSSLWVTLLIGLAACPAPPPPPVEEEPDEPYDGPTSSGIIPSIDPDADAGLVLLDAGDVVVETRCCATTFTISDEEPLDAVGVLEGELAVFQGGVPLSRSDAGWMASACFPISASSHYWYRFSWDGGVEDGGVELLPDGGEEQLIYPVVITSLRASDREPSVTNASGTRNYFREVSSCDGLDGGVPW
jgi:hypothetical protein